MRLLTLIKNSCACIRLKVYKQCTLESVLTVNVIGGRCGLQVGRPAGGPAFVFMKGSAVYILSSAFLFEKYPMTHVNVQCLHTVDNNLPPVHIQTFSSQVSHPSYLKTIQYCCIIYPFTSFVKLILNCFS